MQTSSHPTSINETRIFISNWTVFIIGLLILAWFGCGVYFLMRADWSCLFFFISGAAFLYFKGKILTDKTPQIIVSDKGISTAHTSFYGWEEIGNEQVAIVGEGRQAYVALCYDCPNGREEFSIAELNITPDELAQLLVTYRLQSGKKYKFENNNFLKER